MTIRYTVNQLDNITGRNPENETRLHEQEAIAGVAEFWTARVFDAETGLQLTQSIDVITSRDPLNGDWIGIANGGNYEWAEESFFQHANDTLKSESVARAIEAYLNDFAEFAACK